MVSFSAAVKYWTVLALRVRSGSLGDVLPASDPSASFVIRKLCGLKPASRLAGIAVLLVFAATACVAQTGDPNSATPQQQPASPIATQNERAPYEPITTHERFQWALEQTIGPEHIVSGFFVAGFGTARDAPHEYRGTWAGFGKRFASREASVTLSNTMEAGLGAFWGEDPRYFRDAGLPFGHRIANVVKQTFLARRTDGEFHLAFARYGAITGSNFISNSWRPGSESDTSHALSRTGFGFLGRFGSNAWDEFWPDAKQRIFHRNQ